MWINKLKKSIKTEVWDVKPTVAVTQHWSAIPETRKVCYPLPPWTSYFCKRGIRSSESFRLPPAILDYPGSCEDLYYHSGCLQSACFHGPLRLRVAFRIHQLRVIHHLPIWEQVLLSLLFQILKISSINASKHLWGTCYVLGSILRVFILCFDSFDHPNIPTR